uniref:Uncharacterized protein LOC104211763 n=1 Tax=Nicotiana sylvestris TaxID=4096 RepID=A0A1U7V2J7_NICSY|nr:PREDICTED: uncharacterized protein LOC104211763 [Nicotiana sylvestris]
MCDKKVPLKLKGKFYRAVVRPAMLYGDECWVTKNSHTYKMKVAEMRMLRWICGHTRLDNCVEPQKRPGSHRSGIGHPREGLQMQGIGRICASAEARELTAEAEGDRRSGSGGRTCGIAEAVK